MSPEGVKKNKELKKTSKISAFIDISLKRNRSLKIFCLLFFIVFLIFHFTSLKESSLGKLIYEISFAIVCVLACIGGVRGRYEGRNHYNSRCRQSDDKKINQWIRYFFYALSTIGITFFLFIILFSIFN